MTQSQPKGNRRWYRVVHVNPEYRLVEIQTVSRQAAAEVAESLDADQFIYSDGDGWRMDSIRRVNADELMNPLQ